MQCICYWFLFEILFTSCLKYLIINEVITVLKKSVSASCLTAATLKNKLLVHFSVKLEIVHLQSLPTKYFFFLKPKMPPYDKPITLYLHAQLLSACHFCFHLSICLWKWLHIVHQRWEKNMTPPVQRSFLNMMILNPTSLLYWTQKN